MSTFVDQLPSHLKAGTVYLCERSIYSSFNVFSKLLDLSAEELYMLEEIYCTYAKNMPVKGIIYIQCPVEHCFQRTMSRNHSSDKLLTSEYLTLVHEKYLEWFDQTNIPVFYVSDVWINEAPVEKIISEAIEYFDKNRYKL